MRFTVQFAILIMACWSMPASAGFVEDFCKVEGRPYEYCMENSETDAVLALDEDVRLALFQAINDSRKAQLESSGDTRPAVPACDRVKDFGPVPRASGVWAIKCEDDRMYGVQFDRDSVASGMSCDFLSTMAGTPCTSAVWNLEGKSETGE